ncbi:MAG: modulator of FtsH protease HflC [Desulfovibrionales bacterium]|nr:modulator of FtsH protease HflC [Desulfovibrionales bacterium]
MKKTTPIAVVVGLFVVLLVVYQSVFVVSQIERAIVVQLGKPVAGPLQPGLHFKLPFVQTSINFDARLLDYDAHPAEILTKDKKNMVVDNYSKWRIVRPLQFYKTVRTIASAQAKLDDIIYSKMREALGQYTLVEVVSTKRVEIMSRVTRESNQTADSFGIEVVDVRIKRTDLPPENERAIFGRMRAERERIAKQYRSEGREEGAKIKAQANKERAILLAEAGKTSDMTRGEGDAQSIAIYAQAIQQSPEFYAFKRSLDAYERSFKDNAKMVLTPDDNFLRFLK